MTKLTDTQGILLSTASQRDDGSVLPLPDTIKADGGTSKALASLLKRGLVEERETSDQTAVHRIDGDLRYALHLTPAGASAIGVVPTSSATNDIEGAAEQALASAAQPTTASASAPTRVTKATTVLGLLTRTTGATLPELIEATGWLPHTTRAALTGLRKKGHEIARTKRDGATCYRIAEQA
ncbi:DUF3489 domain-containing protein [Sphingomonas rubra]|uniref:DUF3489 domain-containing protein n=1 Tax=Sphingomonas rubra TaxID=634430 RepID=A0A1I5TMJ5_9SPHN|nr:DUF3489 domain-containing protein [Sphingomonas rubra]SFP84292.1 Protein of unknown function [Sphingomonas rubra]